MVSTKKPSVTLSDFKQLDERAAKGLAVARAIDKKVPIPHSVTVRIHKFDDFLQILTPRRFELLQLSRGGKRSIGELAVAAGRDRSAVSRDIAKLVELGLVRIEVDTRTGDGARKIVRPVAENIEISAAT